MGLDRIFSGTGGPLSLEGEAGSILDPGGGLTTLFGDQGRGAQAAQAAENERTREFIRQQAEEARGDIFQLFPSAEENIQRGAQAGLDVLAQSIPEQLGVFSQGNVGAQRALTQGLPQIQAALLGQPIDFGQIQPQQLDFSTLFAQQQLPNFINTTTALPQETSTALPQETSTALPQEMSGIIGRIIGAL